MLDNITKRRLDDIHDTLVGILPVPTTRVEQITLALIYKFMSDMDKKVRDLGDSKGFFSNGYEQYAWDKLMDKALPARDRVKLYGEGLEKMSINPHLPQLFRNIFKNAFLPFNNPETLKLFLDQIDQFNYDHSEELGNAFEYLLSVMGSQGDAGQFRTPRHIIDFIVKVVDPQKTDRILDPACGTAGFLISAYNHIREKGLTAEDTEALTQNFVGYDISHDMVRLSLVNMYLHHFPNPRIFEYDTLTSEDRWDEEFDCILANPPFMSPKGGIKPHNRFSVPSKRSEVLFVDYIMEHLSQDGKAGVIVPEGIIFQSQTAYKNLRKMMVGDNYLWAMVSLPSGVFNPYSGVKTSVLLFDKKVASKVDHIMFVKVGNDGFDLGAQRRLVLGGELPMAMEALVAYRKHVLSGGELSITGWPSIAEVDTNPLCNFVTKKELTKNGDYILSGERYQSVEKTQSDFRAVCLGDQEYFDIESGGTPDTQNTSYWNGGVNWATLADLPQTNFISEVVGTARTISDIGLQKSSAKLLPIDTVLVSTRATIGRIAITKTPLATNQGFKNVIVKDKQKALPKFVAYALTTKVDEMKKMASGGTFAELSKTNFSRLEIPLPPISVQQDIVEELDHYQKIVDGAKQVIENYGPNFQIEPDWKWTELGEIAVTFSGGTPSRNVKDYWNGDIPWVKTGEVNYGTILETSEQITEKGLRESSAKVAEPGTILMALYGQGVTRGRVAKLGIKAAMNQACLAIVPSEKVDVDFLFFFLQMSYSKLREISIGGNQSNLSAKLVQTLKVPLPPLSAQKEIARRIREEVTVIEKVSELSKTNQLKIKTRIDELLANK